MVDGLVPIEQLRAGQLARIGRVDGHLDHVHRLRELGLFGGTEIEVYQPGNPCIIRIAGNKVCIRSDNRLNVFVRPHGGEN
jgi:Fe2+ transport system protein FeoA